MYCSQAQNGKIKVHRQFGYKLLNTKTDGERQKRKVGDSTSTKTSNNIFTLGFRIIHEFQKSFFLTSGSRDACKNCVII